MDLQTKLLYLFIDLILPLAIGYLCRFQSKLDKNFFQRLIVINICVIYPILSVLTLWALSLNYSLIWLPIIGVLLCIIPGIAAYFRVQNKFQSELDKGSYILSAILSNTTTLGGLCAYILYGELGYAYALMIVMLQNIVMFTFCFPLAQYYYQKSVGSNFSKQSVSTLFMNRTQLPVVGMTIGIILNATGIVRPAALELMVDPLVHLGAWTALIPIGYAIDTAGMREYYLKILDLISIKFILTPVAAYMIASLLISDEIILNTIVILAAMPTAINTVIAVQVHKLNVNIATAAFVLTTAVFIGIELPVLFVWMSGR
ncbi:transporter [Anaerosporomusa subterranea]|uniref:Transporter n=1 Tax=Anaerosporomusa subterranea TaxID=1794912 RepID=A0A154BPS1_ANASB|nr:transporter [Anaerosporomusa subterranea]KYZ75498.1 transporter [Anaerosporomusa subterranea]